MNDFYLKMVKLYNLIQKNSGRFYFNMNRPVKFLSFRKLNFHINSKTTATVVIIKNTRIATKSLLVI